MNTTFAELLAREGKLIYRTRGVSMEPMLRQDRDLVIIETPSGELKPLDTALYRRGRQYVLHRVIRVKDDCYLIRGDNTYTMETVPKSDVIGVLTGFQRKGKQYDANMRAYRCYARFWNFIYPLRYGLRICRRAAGKAARKLGFLPLIRKIVK
ncbi:MAG: S24/S26 family peptidase [Lachnospiraceae bacterium]|nr:S24/S26 family peptidase [Lachnospiraceae bacterium]